MGNKLCCENPVRKQSSRETAKLASSQLEQFMQTYKEISQVYNKQKQKYQTVDRTEMLFFGDGVYIGNSINDQRIGFGIMLYKQYGIYYEGYWKENAFQGVGYMVFHNGDIYEGEWRNGVPQGEGVYIHAQSNWSYSGTWQSGMQHGKGKQIFGDGSRFQGFFREGKRHGKGFFKTKQGDIYEGQFSQGEINGHGTIKMDYYTYQGEFKNGVIEGTGKSKWFDENNILLSTYIGEYQQSQKHGFGQYHDEGGLKYKGRWDKGNIARQGVYIEIKQQKKRS